MRVTVFGSSSSGNAYAIEFENGQILLLEAGMPYKKIAKAFPGRWSDVLGCLITHEHKDHSRYIEHYIDAGIVISASEGTLKKLGINSHLKVNRVHGGMIFKLAEDIYVYPFDVKHNADEPLGYMIIDKNSDESLLFITDSAYLDYSFKDINYYMVECNYIDEIVLQTRLKGDYTAPNYHMSLSTCIKFLGKCTLTNARKIILIHLSGVNSDEEKMVNDVRNSTGIDTVAASPGMILRLSKEPF